MSSKRWLSVYVKMHHEKKTRDRIEALGIETFLPIQNVMRQWSDRRKMIEKVVISMMVFVHVDAVQQRQVLTVPSVLRYFALRGERQPTPIPDKQLEQFRFMLDYSDNAVVFSDQTLTPGESVRVIKGPLTGLEGELMTINGKTHVTVRIEQMGCAMVEVNVTCVEQLRK